jgi:hypothetical protein
MSQLLSPRPPSHIPYPISHIPCPVSQIPCYMSYVHIPYPISQVPYPKSQVPSPKSQTTNLSPRAELRSNPDPEPKPNAIRRSPVHALTPLLPQTGQRPRLQPMVRGRGTHRSIQSPPSAKRQCDDESVGRSGESGLRAEELWTTRERHSREGHLCELDVLWCGPLLCLGSSIRDYQEYELGWSRTGVLVGRPDRGGEDMEWWSGRVERRRDGWTETCSDGENERTRDGETERRRDGEMDQGRG